MRKLTPHERARLAVAAGVLSAMAAIGVVALSARDDATDAVLEDAGLSRHGFGDRRVTDLLTRPIEPGETSKVGVNLPRGSRMIDVVGAGGFEIVSSNHTDGDRWTWLEIVVRNDTPAPMRFVGFVAYDVNPQGTP